MDLFNKCLKTVESCLADAKMNKSAIHDVVLVGGSSRIPKVQQLLQEFFAGKDLCKSINPDEVVAYGVAVQAALLSEDFKNVPNFVIQDVAPLPLGIVVHGDIMNVVIANEKPIGSKKEIIIINNKERLSSQEIEEKIREAENYRVEDKKFLRRANLMNTLEVCVYKLRNALPSQKTDKINSAINRAPNLVGSKQQSEIHVLENHLKELESILTRIIRKCI